MANLTIPEIEQKILDYLKTRKQVKVRSVFKAIGQDKRLVDEAIVNLAKADRVEYLYLDTSYVAIKEG